MDLDRIRKLADAFDASDWDEVHLVVDGVEIHFAIAAAGPDALAATPSAAPAAAPAADVPGSASAPAATAESAAGPGVPAEDEAPPAAATLAPTSAAADGDAGAEAEPVPAEVPPDATGTPVPAPSPGIFWRSPSPGQPPFVSVGTRVVPDTVVCIVELMKLMNRVVAGVAGTVTAVLVENGRPVDKAESVVLIEPDAAGS